MRQRKRLAISIHPLLSAALVLFVLVFGQAPEEIVVRGRPDASGDRIPVAITGLGPDPVAAQFQRR